MNKPLIIIALCLFLGACATNEPAPQRAHSLLDYADLAAEITVRYESLAVEGDTERTAVDAP